MSFSLLADKEQTTYEKLFKESNKNIIKYSINNNYLPKFIHIDWKNTIAKAIKKIFPNIKIRYYRYCLWHFKRNLEIHKNQLCKAEVESDESIYILYKCNNNLPFIDPAFIIDIYNKIINETDNIILKNFCNILKKLIYYHMILKNGIISKILNILQTMHINLIIAILMNILKKPIFINCYIL